MTDDDYKQAVEHRLTRIEDDVNDLKGLNSDLALVLERLVTEFRVAKWVIAAAYGIVQPVIVAIIVIYMQR